MQRPPHSDASALARWASLEYRRRWVVLGVWATLLATLITAAVLFGGTFSNSFELPGTEAQEAIDLLNENFPSEAGEQAAVVFKSATGIADPAVRAQIAATLDEIAAFPFVVRVESPLDIPPYVSADGSIARAVVQFFDDAGAIAESDLDALYAVVDEANGPGLQVEIGGHVVSETEQDGPGSEAIGMLAAVVILLLVFGSIVAAGLPLAGAVFGLGTGIAIVTLLASVFSFPGFAPQFASMIGIGVGIDYALLVVTRYREGLHKGLDVESAIVESVTTAGRSVIFAGVVVAISFLGLAFMGIPFVTGMGITGAIVVATAVLVALTLMPALLGFAGHSIDRWHIPVLRSSEGIDENSVWFRLSRRIQRNPLPFFIVPTVLLLALGAPILAINLSFTDDGNKSEEFRTRRTYDLLSEGFGPGFNGIILLVVDGPETEQSLDSIIAAVADHPNIERVFPPRLSEDGTTAVISAAPKTSPQDPVTTSLIHDLRNNVIPSVTGEGVEVFVTGGVAATSDIKDRITARLPYLFAGVIGLSFLLLMAVFRSVLVALKAAILNLLSISVSFGVLVVIFQWGWGASLIGVQPGPIEVFLPMMLFAILFGLSMDYEVFLISRIREEYLRTGDNALAVSNGLAATARVITAAAAIMVTLFLSFALGDDRVIKEFGIGLATAIFVDATIVRLILVPATMELLGDANWWLPKWLDRILPNIELDQRQPDETSTMDESAGG